MVSECCPCALPECAAPRVKCQSLAGTGQLAWVIYTYSLDTYYQTTRSDYSGGGFRQRHMSQPFNAWFTPLPAGAVSMAELQLTEGDPQTGAVTYTHSNPIDVDAARAAAFDALTAALDWENEDFSQGIRCASSRRNVEPSSTYDFLFFATWARYRIGVPEDFSTTENPRGYYEVQWDEVEASGDWWTWFDDDMYGDEPDGGPALVASKSWLWGGDMEAPWSDWHELPPPDTTGNEIRVVNMMVKCWKSVRLGVAPTAHGDVVELAP